MSNLSVLSRTQRIIVDPATSSIRIINAGPMGPPGIPGGGGGGGGPTTLDDLTDAVISSHAAGRILVANGTNFVDVLGTSLYDAYGTATAAINAVVNGAGPALDTLIELGALITAGDSAAAALATTVAGKQNGHANLTALAGQAITAFALSLMTDVDAAGVRTRISTYSKAEVDGITDGITAGAPRGVRYVAAPVGNATTDAAAIVTAFSGITSGTIVDFYPNGLYQIDQTTLTALPAGIKLRMNNAQVMGDSSISGASSPSDGYKAGLRITGAISTTSAITTAIAPGGLTTTMASNAIGLAAGSWVSLVSNKLYSPPRNEHQYGQYLTVRSITGAGPYTITFEEAVIDDYALVDVPVLRKITAIKDLEIESGTAGLENDVIFDTNRVSGMVLKYIDGLTVTNLKINGNDRTRCGLVVRCCRRGVLWVHAENVSDPAGSPPLGREAYGVVLLSCDDIELHVTGRRCRHLQDVGAFGDEPPSDRIKVWYEGSLTWAGVGSSHGGARFIDWMNAVAMHGGGGLILRNRYNNIRSLTVIGTSAGLDPNGTSQSNNHAFQCGETSNYAQRTLTFRERTSNVAKLTTSVAHLYDIGAKVTIVSSDATFNGNFTITAVTSTTFSFANVGSNLASTATTGTSDGDDYGAPGAINLKAQRIYMDLTQRDGSGYPFGMYFKGPVDNANVDNFTIVGNTGCAVMVHGETTKSLHYGTLDVDCTLMAAGWPAFAVAPGGGNAWEGQVPTTDNGETFDLITIDILRVRNPESAPVAIMGGTATTKSGKLHIRKLELINHSTARLAATDPLIRILGGYVGEVQIDVIDAPLMRRSGIISLENGAVLAKRTIGQMNGAAFAGSAGRTDEPLKYLGVPRPASYGIGAYSFPPGGSISSTIPTSGTLHVVTVDVPPMNITGFGMMQTLLGTAVTSGFGAYFTKAVGGARLGITADTVADWGATGVKSPALVVPFNWDGGELYMAFFVVWTGTGPTFERGSSGGAANLLAPAGLPACGVANAGISAMPATLGAMTTGGTTANFMMFPIGTLL